MFDEGTPLKVKVATWLVCAAMDTLFIIGSWLLWAVVC